MNFVSPFFLFALAAVSIPVIIHLFNFRQYKTVFFSNVKFLKQIKQQTKARSQLKHLLILLSRILAFACLVFAFAEPYIPVLNNQQNGTSEIIEHVSIYLDNSFSMDAEGEEGKLLEAAKKKAKSIAEIYPARAKFLLVTNDFELKHQHFINKEQLLQSLNEIKISPRVKNMSEIVSRQIDFMTSSNSSVPNQKGKSNNTVFLISDFQKSSSDFERIKSDSALNIHLVPMAGRPINNLFIDSCWFDSPGRKLYEAENLSVRVVNFSNESYQNIPIKFLINDTLKSLASFNIGPNTSEIINLNYTNNIKGFLKGSIEITDYPITFDNTFYLNYSMVDSIRLLTLSDKGINKYIEALFRDDKYIVNKNGTLNSVKPSDFKNYQVIILDRPVDLSSGLAQEFNNYIMNGGSLIFFPSFDGNRESYNHFLGMISNYSYSRIDSQRTEIKTIDYSNPIYKNVFKKMNEEINLPEIYRQFVLENKGLGSSEVIISCQNNHPVLISAISGKGKAYIFSIPLEPACSNLVKHPILVPTLYNMTLLYQNMNSIYQTIGRNEVVEINNFQATGQEVFHVLNPKTNFDFIPQQFIDTYNSSIKLNIQQNIVEAGHYFITFGNKYIQGVSFNYDRKESVLNYFSNTELTELISKYNLTNMSLVDAKEDYLAPALEQISKGRQLWKLFILFTLFFLITEILLIKLWK